MTETDRMVQLKKRAPSERASERERERERERKRERETEGVCVDQRVRPG